MTNSIALIGGAGFIGTNLTNFFIAKKYKVLVISRTSSIEFTSNDSQLERKVIDVNHTSKIIEALSEYENVVWLVNNLLPSISMDSLIDDFDFNVNPLIRFLESAKSLKKLKRLIFISSGGTIYGDTKNKINLKEDSQKKPISSYGLSKIISENYIEFITKRSAFESYILRPSNVYGNYQNLNKPQGIIGYAFNAILTDKSINLFDEGKMTRDFIHVLDLAAAISSCIENKHKKGEVRTYNVGSEKGYTIKEVLELINEVSNKKLNTNLMPARAFDCDYNVLDCEKIKTDLNWEANIELINGLHSVWNWIKSREE